MKTDVQHHGQQPCSQQPWRGREWKLSFSNKIISYVSVRPYRSLRLHPSRLSTIFNALHRSKDDKCHTSRQKKCWLSLTNHLVSARKSFGLKRLFWLPKTKLQMILASSQKYTFFGAKLAAGNYPEGLLKISTGANVGKQWPFVKNIRCFHTYKSWNAVLNSAHWLHRLLKVRS